MNNKLRIIDNIKILNEHDNVAMACQLICDSRDYEEDDGNDYCSYDEVCPWCGARLN